MRRWSAILVLAFACSACFRSTTTINLRPDGSGTIVQDTGMNAQAMAMLKGFAGAGDKGNTGFENPFTEEQARKAADQMGVKFVSGEPIKTEALEGYRAHFAFDDIRQLKMRMEQQPASMPGGSGNAKPAPQTPYAFDFVRQGASSVLTIHVPDQKPSSTLEPMGLGGANADPQAKAQALMMMKTMMAGLFVDVTLAVDGHIVKTNAPFVDGQRVTLLQVDFDRLLADPAGFERLQSAKDYKALKGVPGLKVLTDPTVSIEFGR